MVNLIEKILKAEGWATLFNRKPTPIKPKEPYKPTRCSDAISPEIVLYECGRPVDQPCNRRLYFGKKVYCGQEYVAPLKD